MSQQFILVVYDLSDDRRRTKLHNTLLNYGTPVQYSVFECLLDEQEEVKMRQAVRRVIRPRKDHVRFYLLCLNCRQKIETTLGKELLGPLPPALVIG